MLMEHERRRWESFTAIEGRGKGAIETVGEEARWEAEEQRQILPSPAIKMNIILGESINARWKGDGSQEVKYMLARRTRRWCVCNVPREGIFPASATARTTSWWISADSG
jgi:hypothetical protein